jgi:hypothetical protein
MIKKKDTATHYASLGEGHLPWPEKVTVASQVKLEFVCGCLSLQMLELVGPAVYVRGQHATSMYLGAYPVAVFLNAGASNFDKTSHLDHFCLKEPFGEAVERVIDSISREYNLRLGNGRS